MAYSSVVEQRTVNATVFGSSPDKPARFLNRGLMSQYTPEVIHLILGTLYNIVVVVVCGWTVKAPSQAGLSLNIFEVSDIVKGALKPSQAG